MIGDGQQCRDFQLAGRHPGGQPDCGELLRARSAQMRQADAVVGHQRCAVLASCGSALMLEGYDIVVHQPWGELLSKRDASD